MAPMAAVMSSALVTSNDHTYWLKIFAATPMTLPSALASASPLARPKVTDPIPAMRSRPRATASRSPAQRWPLIVSTSESEESTPTSIRTKRNSIITAPV